MRAPMKKARTWMLIPLLALGAVLMDCSCDFFGTTGALFIPETKEAELGRSFDSTLRHDPEKQKEFPIFKTNGDPAREAFQAYVLGVANKVLAAVPESEKTGYPFTFTLIDKDVENAFAVPGGYVYLYTGIIAKMKDESELAGVLGHEIAHVTWHHYRDALAKQAGMGVLLEALLGDNAGALANAVAQSFFALAALKVSRSNESEADHYGAIYCARADRNPLGIAKYFARSQGAGIPDWLSSHPGSDDRVDEVTKHVNSTASLKAVAADSARTNNTAEFLAKTSILPR